MKRILLRIAAALGITAAATVALIYGTSDGDLRKVRASALLTLPDGGQLYRTLGVPVLLQSDGGVTLPTEHAASCFASVRLGALTRAQGVGCLDGGTAPVRVQWVGGEHDAPGDCDDPEVCEDGEGVALVDGACAARGWPDAGACLVDGQPAPYGVTLAAGTWSGAGCIPRVCVVFAHGGSGVDPGWPDDAPLQLGDGGLIPPRTESP